MSGATKVAWVILRAPFVTVLLFVIVWFDLRIDVVEQRFLVHDESSRQNTQETTSHQSVEQR